MTIREQVAQYNPEAILWDDLDEAIIGMTTNGHAVYDVNLIHEILMNTTEMNLDEAIDYTEYNILCAHVGDFTPIHIVNFKYE